MTKESHESIHHSFDINLATKLGGVDLAIFYHHISYWIAYNTRTNKNFRDGKYWTYQTFEDLHGHFPYWSIKQLRLIVEKLTKAGILIKGNFNDNRYLHTIWYTIDSQKVESMCPNGQIDNPKWENPKSEMGESIEDNIPYNKQHVVVVARDPAPCAISKGREFTKDDVHYHCVRTKQNWTSEEIEEAWNSFSKIISPITDKIAYITGIINKKRVIEDAKQQQIKINEGICKRKMKKENSEKFLKNQSEMKKYEFSEKIMPMLTLAEYEVSQKILKK